MYLYPRASRSVERLARDPKRETTELVIIFFVSEKNSVSVDLRQREKSVIKKLIMIILVMSEW